MIVVVGGCGLTDVRAESSVLEVCCGLGYGAGAALLRGARAIGIDFAPAMVEAARERYPAAAFRQGDAEALNFDSGVFDAVICAFGVNHFQHPEKAIAEALRVLRPGGRYAFTMWCVPGKSKFHQLVLESIRSHGTLDVLLPAAPRRFASVILKPARQHCSVRASLVPTLSRSRLSFGHDRRSKSSI